jgi:hypothetical protein
MRSHHQGRRAQFLESVEQRLGSIDRLERSYIVPNPTRRNAFVRIGSRIQKPLTLEPSKPPAVARDHRQVRKM